jgi:hypothetical protein
VNQLLPDLFKAYYDARQNKRNTIQMLNKWNCYFESWDEQKAPPAEVLAEFRAQINS